MYLVFEGLYLVEMVVDTEVGIVPDMMVNMEVDIVDEMVACMLVGIEADGG